MDEYIRGFGLFLWMMFCAILAVAMEYAGQAFVKSGEWIMGRADAVNQHAEEIFASMPSDELE